MACSATDKTVDSIMHVLEAVVVATSSIGVARVRERRIVRLVSDELVSQVVNAIKVRQRLAHT